MTYGRELERSCHSDKVLACGLLARVIGISEDANLSEVIARCLLAMLSRPFETDQLGHPGVVRLLMRTFKPEGREAANAPPVR